jgi:hypothetical protein
LEVKEKMVEAERDVLQYIGFVLGVLEPPVRWSSLIESDDGS